MPKNDELSSKDLEKRIDLLIKRFEEQKGIIDSYRSMNFIFIF